MFCTPRQTGFVALLERRRSRVGVRPTTSDVTTHDVDRSFVIQSVLGLGKERITIQGNVQKQLI